MNYWKGRASKNKIRVIDLVALLIKSLKRRAIIQIRRR